MPSKKSAGAIKSKDASKSELTDAEKQEQLDQAAPNRERLAESQLEMAKWFLENQKLEIAQRRLKAIITDFDGSNAAEVAKSLLLKL